MQLDFNKEGNVEGVLTLSIHADDYQENLTNSLKKYQKTMRFPGFRVGKTPMGLVKKQLGSDLKKEEVNKIIQSQISEYYKKHSDEIIYLPLMNKPDDDFSWDSSNELKFNFRVALKPDVKVNLDLLKDVTYNKLVLLEDELNFEIDSLRKQYGDVDKLEDIIDHEDLVTVLRAVELDESDETLEGGIKKMIRLEWNNIPEKLKEVLLGKKADDEFKLDFKSLLTETELCEIFEIEKNVAKDLGNSFMVTMQGSVILRPAELNEVFYLKIFNDHTIADEEGFRAKVTENLGRFFEDKDLQILQGTVKDKLLENADIVLPDEFLEEWFKVNANLKEDDDYIEELDSFKEDTKWDLILDTLAKEHEQEVSDGEVKNAIRSYVLQQYAYQIQNLDKDQVELMAENLYNKEYFRFELKRSILATKVVNELKNKGTFTTNELSKVQFEEFVKENDL